MPPDFLNSREDAILLWALVILAFAFYKNFRGMASGVYWLLRAALQWKLLLLYATTGAYCAAVVYGARELGLWHTTALKATIYWFVGTAAVLVGEAVSDASPSDPEFLRRVLRRMVAWTVVVEFVVNLYVFPFVFEAVILLIVLLFVGMQAVIESGLTPADPATRKLIEIVIGTVGTSYFVYFLVRVFTDLDGFLTRENAEDFLVGPALTLTLIPLLYAVASYSRREVATVRKQFSL